MENEGSDVLIDRVFATIVLLFLAVVPSTEITGGPWYNEQEFDHVFIDTLSTFVYEVIKASGMSTLNAITDKVHASGISKVALGPEEIGSIIQMLMYDGRVEEVRSVRLTPGVRKPCISPVAHSRLPAVFSLSSHTIAACFASAGISRSKVQGLATNYDIQLPVGDSLRRVSGAQNVSKRPASQQCPRLLTGHVCWYDSGVRSMPGRQRHLAPLVSLYDQVVKP